MAVKGTNVTPEPVWDVMQELPLRQRSSLSRTLLSGWDRFSVRHLLLWMMSIAFAIAAFRIFHAFRQSNQSHSSFFAAWFRASLDFQDYMIAITTGSILGLGIPAILTGPANSKFSEHPARVLFALCIALVTLNLALQFSGIDPLLGTWGGSATGFVWSLYALIRPRIGWLWRVVILLLCLSCVWSFCCCGLLISQAAPSFLAKGPFASYRVYVPYNIDFIDSFTFASILLGTGFALMVAIAGSVEIIFGKFKDWRTWSATILIPVCVFLFALPLMVEIVRGIQLEQMTKR